MNRLRNAMIAYGALGIAAWFLLTGSALLIVGVVLLAFAAKTLLWHFRPPQD
ncbi:MAG TPA: hypothetical protein VHC72_22200 [Bryobacteraceae bacterium]|nr:hypothetical protein [Bryobacteraceae bacterium]